MKEKKNHRRVSWLSFQLSPFHIWKVFWRMYLVLVQQALSDRYKTAVERSAMRIHVAMPKLHVYILQLSLLCILLFLLSRLFFNLLQVPPTHNIYIFKQTMILLFKILSNPFVNISWWERYRVSFNVIGCLPVMFNKVEDACRGHQQCSVHNISNSFGLVCEVIRADCPLLSDLPRCYDSSRKKLATIIYKDAL